MNTEPPRRGCLAVTAIALWSPVALVAAALTATILWAFVGLPLLVAVAFPLRLARRVGGGRTAPAWWGAVGLVLAALLTVLGVGAAVVQPEQPARQVGLTAAAAGWGVLTIWSTAGLTAAASGGRNPAARTSVRR